MITRIMKHELTLLSRETILYIAIPIYAFLIAYGVVNGTAWKNFLAVNTAEAVRLADKGFKSNNEKLDRILSGQDPYNFQEDPRVPAALSRSKSYEMAAKPPSSTAAIAIGQSDILPSYLKVQWKPMFRQSNTDEIENPRNLAVGALDLGFVLIYLYPLLVIALSYNVLSSERESGTQVLLLSQPVSVAQFVLGKLLLRGAIVIGLAAGISVLGILIGNADIISAGDLWRVFALAIILVLYGVFWFGLAVLVNAFGAKSAANALVMMAIWIALVLIVPAGLNLAAKSLYPLPSRIELVEAVRRADIQVQRGKNVDGTYRADLLRKGQEEALEASTTDFYKTLMPLEQQSERISAPIFAKFDSRRRSQQELTERFKYVSPAAVTQLALSELANNSTQDFNHFNDQVERYHQTWRAYFYPAVLASRLFSRDELRSIPRFHYLPEAAGVVMFRVVKDVLALAIFAGLILAVGFARLRKYSAAGR